MKKRNKLEEVLVSYLESNSLEIELFEVLNVLDTMSREQRKEFIEEKADKYNIQIS